MSLNCPQGHSWESDTTPAVCPVCGQRSVGAPLTAAPARDEISVLLSIDAGHPTSSAVAPPRVGTFTVVRMHAQGGLGSVSVARDPSLGREVALKQIKSELADDPRCRHRFITEAEITGQLEHPGIVPVYALGHDTSGRPYYAMKFVHGRTLDDAAAAYHAAPTPAAFRDLLRRFVSVCQAVAYAHSRGVIHRDLKPSNVMLGEFGETLILDWGLAKRTSATESAGVLDATSMASPIVTLAGQVLGTPMYMAPEQASGDPSRHGPASDIYALGAILYHLLTGKPAHDGQTHEQIVTRLKQLEPPPRPASVARGVNRALEAICLKAMSPQPSDRYKTADDLAADIERWQADEPVSVYREPITARVARLARRHKSIAIGGAAVFAVLLIGIAATSWQMLRAQRAEAIATKEKLLAQKRFDEVRTLAGKFMFDYHDQIQNLAGATPAVKMLVATSREYLARLAADAGDDRQLQVELAVAYEKIGDIQGNPNHGSNLGDTQGALESYHKSLDIRRKLRGPATHSSRPEAVLLSRIGDIRQAQGDTAAAIESYRQGLAILESTAAMQPNDARALRDVTVSYARIGELLQLQGDLDGAMAAYDRAAAAAEKAARDNPDLRAQVDVTGPYERKANLLIQRGETKAALAILEKTVRVISDALQKDSTNARYQTALGRTHTIIGQARAAAGDAAGASDSYAMALAIATKLAAADPADANAQQNLVVIRNRLGDLRQQVGDLEGALANFRAMLEICQRMSDRDPSSAAWRRHCAVCHQRIADILHRTGREDQALAEYRACLNLIRTTAERDPANVDAQRDLWVSYGNISELLGKAAIDPDTSPENRQAYLIEAQRYYTAALAILDRKDAPSPTLPGDAGVIDDYRASLRQIDDLLGPIAPTTLPATRP